MSPDSSSLGYKQTHSQQAQQHRVLSAGQRCSAQQCVLLLLPPAPATNLACPHCTTLLPCCPGPPCPIPSSLSCPALPHAAPPPCCPGLPCPMLPCSSIRGALPRCQVVCLTLYRPDKFELWWADNARSRSLPAAFLFTDSSRTLQVRPTSGWVQGVGFGGWGLECRIGFSHCS